MTHIRNFSKTKAQLDEAVRLVWPTEPPPTPAWCLFGSAVLQMHGLRDDISDVDIAVDHRLWERLARTMTYSVHLPEPEHPAFLERYDAGGLVHVFYAWRKDEPEVDLVWARRLSERIGDGYLSWPCAPLVQVRDHKLWSVRRHGGEGRWAKHVSDVAAIDAHILGTGV